MKLSLPLLQIFRVNVSIQIKKSSRSQYGPLQIPGAAIFFDQDKKKCHNIHCSAREMPKPTNHIL